MKSAAMPTQKRDGSLYLALSRFFWIINRISVMERAIMSMFPFPLQRTDFKCAFTQPSG